MATHLSFFVRPSGSREGDIRRGLVWLVEASKKYPDMPPLLAVNDTRSFDCLIQPAIGHSWDEIRRKLHGLVINDIPVWTATERTIGDPWHHVVLLVYPIPALIEKAQTKIHFVREIAIVDESMQAMEEWIKQCSAIEISS